ncbi:Transmembrane protein 79 [Holothuria leucospilota]|uniref:Transmembrane protein 79 n=1 Tax=Holothuria leucospilota TaxID=206669 RepID=A0A9Q1BPW5_HOLLE|nr:Transmembrane protein 79 [Holothuria leucospilota]
MQKAVALEQKTLRRRVYLVTCVMLVCCYLAVHYAPLPTPNEPSLINRVVFTTRCLVVSLIPLMFGIGVVGAMRYYDMENMGANPVKEKVTYKFDVTRRYLQNTLEQTILHVILQLSLSTFLPNEYLPLIPTFITFFVIGRIIFLIGYMDEKRPINRGPGFAITWLTNIFSFLLCLVFLIWKGPSYQP